MRHLDRRPARCGVAVEGEQARFAEHLNDRRQPTAVGGRLRSAVSGLRSSLSQGFKLRTQHTAACVFNALAQRN
jgi:hypothetical protein